ncbi:DNA N-6-adenine-methyltransferase [Rhizobium sp. AN80A]|uniref:DNA N-6-adenine-methyltransferase n=1 Tax=Rhizobium sp. AN80A TaxID=3040673 RepID=UPI0024B37E0F|nr:DNA N-6-adenine-methyltransferase [Rhizobium sp. AN80A]
MSYWDTLGKSDEWYTPKHVFDALGCDFDVDVAHPKDCDTFVPAKKFITENSLQRGWYGFAWMNPPFGGRNGLAPWLDKFFEHGNGIALVPDRTSTPWFRDAWSKADAVLFTPKLRFHRPDGTIGKSPSNGTALFGVGSRALIALNRAHERGLGILGQPVKHSPSARSAPSFDPLLGSGGLPLEQGNEK